MLATAAFAYSPPARSAPTRRLLVLIPAHDEEALIARCIRSLLDQSYPRELYRLAVVADNCSDDTARLAGAAGADLVLSRQERDAPGKGRALRWAMDRLLPLEPLAEAVVVVDADSVAEPGFLLALVQPFEAGARAVQGESLLYGDGTRRSALRVSAFILINRVRPAGRAALGLGATHLAGNGMLLARDLLLERPWGAFTSAEDLEYSLGLHAEGITIAFAGGAVLLSPTAPHSRAAAQQQLRWEGGKALLARRWIPRLLAAAVHRPGLVGIAFELALPPLGYLAAAVLVGTLIAAGLAAPSVTASVVLVPWLVGAAAILLFVLVGLKAGRAPGSAYCALVGAPLFVLAKPFHAWRVLRFRGDTWVRTERA
jgi:cellulose synthase/poly-beta-1,6-N-acetylglucosamine synthase-like glycosyltransferase